MHSKPKVNYLVIFLFAGHSVMTDDGMQAFLFNEFDKKAQCNKLLQSE